MNIIILKGRLTRDPEINYTQSGKAVCSFDIAYNQTKEKVFFFNCQAWEKTAENITKYFKKGNEILFQGELIQTTWEKEGKKQSRIIINVTRFDFIGLPKEKTESNQNPWR